jgi:hypothetical protein
MKGSGLWDDMKLGFNNMQTKANGLWTNGTSKLKSMFSSNQDPYQPAYQTPYQPVSQPAYQTPYQPVAQPPYQPVAQQQLMGGMPAYNFYQDKLFTQVHGYQTAKPLTYVSGYGGGKNIRRGGATCSIADLPYSTTETGSSYSNKLTGGKKIRINTRRKSRKEKHKFLV